jgi:kanamycin kinase/aminoglycoside 3'-phosphotransferase-3
MALRRKDDYMIKLEKELNIKIPKSIINIIKRKKYNINNTGLSNSIVILFKEYCLKIFENNNEFDNEIKVFNALKNKLNIAKIIKYESLNNKYFLLKEKLKGRTLSNSYYMNRPNLLYSYAAKALNILWNININNLDLINVNDYIVNNAYSNIDISFINKKFETNFNSLNEIINYLKINRKENKLVLCHGDLCLPNIIINKNKIGFIDLGLMGKSSYYHDLSVLYRSIKYNFNGVYGISYKGYNDNLLFDLLNIKKDNNLLKYYLLLDELA